MLDPTARLAADEAIVGESPEMRQTDQGFDPEVSVIVQRLVRQVQIGKDSLTPWGQNVRSVGVDMARVADFNSHLNATSIERNFTQSEVERAMRHVDVRAASAGRWSAKEAVSKCLRTPSRGAGAAMKSIEIVACEGGIPTVVLSGDALLAAGSAALSDISLSMSYEGDYVVAIAIGLK
ncbi:hypothetical protein LTR66_005748 [Elasticomyces elasticus]|nr:hypothetical protein LTR66_005748 [Elasticomyces elasticus]